MPKSPTKAYVLLQSVGNNRSQVIKILKRQAGVVAVDPVEGPPDVILVIEAPDRRELASVLMKAMTSVQNMTDGLRLFPTPILRRENSWRKATANVEGSA